MNIQYPVFLLMTKVCDCNMKKWEKQCTSCYTCFCVFFSPFRQAIFTHLCSNNPVMMFNIKNVPGGLQKLSWIYCFFDGHQYSEPPVC